MTMHFYWKVAHFARTSANVVPESAQGLSFFLGGGNGRKFGWEEERGGRGLIVSPLVYRREGSGLGRSGMGGGEGFYRVRQITLPSSSASLLLKLERRNQFPLSNFGEGGRGDFPTALFFPRTFRALLLYSANFQNPLFHSLIKTFLSRDR